MNVPTFIKTSCNIKKKLWKKALNLSMPLTLLDSLQGYLDKYRGSNTNMSDLTDTLNSTNAISLLKL